MKNNLILSADIGGTHISCAVVDIEKESIVPNTKITAPVDSSADAGSILAALGSAVKETCLHGSSCTGAAFSIPGPFDYGKGISLIRGVGKYESLYGMDLKRFFSQTAGLEEEKIQFINDASAFALGEYHAGNGKNCARMTAITLGTGFGSTFLDSGKIVSDSPDVPEGGMFWNIPYKNSIADDYFSTRWFIESYFQATGIKAENVKEIALMHKHNKGAQKVFNEFAFNLSSFLMPWLSLFGTEKLIIGGKIALAADLFVPLIEYAFENEKLKTKIEISKLWDDAPIIGAANLFRKD